MERRRAGLLAVGCLACCDAICGQATSPRIERDVTNLLQPKGSGKTEANLDGARAADGPRAEDGVATVIVIGFVGGFVRHENAVHSPVQLGARLKKAYSAEVYVQVFENSKREQAYRKILELLGTSESGKSITEREKQQARIVIYGMSWGGSETVTLAKELEAQKIPVLLTVQVDSVGKIGENDGVIPRNVAEAVNFYQNNGLLHGRPAIRAEDARRTKILGNFRYDYKAKPVSCQEYPWYDRMLTKYHTEIECDPAVWNRVEALIREKLPSPDRKTGPSSSETKAGSSE